jgi:hypothetical protein
MTTTTQASEDSLLRAKLERVTIDTADWPRCGRCEMPVEQFWADVTPRSLIFVAVCHGKTETVEIPDELWDNSLPTTSDFGPAFSGAALHPTE